MKHFKERKFSLFNYMCDILYDFYERSLSFSDIENYLLKSDFTMYDISHISKNPMNGRTDWIDVIYVNNRLRKKTAV